MQAIGMSERRDPLCSVLVCIDIVSTELRARPRWVSNEVASLKAWRGSPGQRGARRGLHGGVETCPMVR